MQNCPICRGSTESPCVCKMDGLESWPDKPIATEMSDIIKQKDAEIERLKEKLRLFCWALGLQDIDKLLEKESGHFARLGKTIAMLSKERVVKIAALKEDIVARDAEIAAIKSWQESVLKIEASWDCYAVGKAIGVNMWGENIREKILPYILKQQAEIERLKERIKELEASNRKLREAMEKKGVWMMDNECRLYVKKPICVEAIRWSGMNLKDIINFIGMHESAKKWTWEEYEAVVENDGLKIFTLEGVMHAEIGDWIIKGIKGEFYPCKPDMFNATYDAA